MWTVACQFSSLKTAITNETNRDSQRLFVGYFVKQRFTFPGSVLLALLRAEFLRPAHGGRSASRFARHLHSG